MIRGLDPDPLHVQGDEPDPSPRSEWQTVITLAVAMIVAAFVLGYVWGKVAG